MSLATPKALAPLALAVWLSACATASRNRGWVSDELGRRTGQEIQAEDGERSLPPGVDLADGLSEDEASALALWNSPTFAADMARLTSARADFAEAARPDNPRLTLQAPIGMITAAASLLAPVMSFFQIPKRTQAAGRALEAVAESLVQSGLDLVRDARVAHADCVFTVERVAIERSLLETADELARIAGARAEAGEISPSDALIVRADASLAADRLALAQRDAITALARLHTLLGSDEQDRLQPVAERALPEGAPLLGSLIAVARESRPDVRAARLELEGAAARLGWERSRIVTLSAQADVQWNRSQAGVRVGGVMELPIFNQNQGGRGRAEAAIEQAMHRLVALQQRVTLEVITARVSLETALASKARYAANIVPPLDAALEAAKLQFQLGDQSYLVVLDVLGRLGLARARMAELDAEVRRAHAELERSVGARVEVGS